MALKGRSWEANGVMFACSFDRFCPQVIVSVER